MTINQTQVTLPSDRLFDPNPRQKEYAQQLYETVADLPLFCPHDHVDPRLFADPDYTFGTPTEFFIILDHYVFRMLYSQGISMATRGIPRRDGGSTEQDRRQTWQIFAENFYLFRGTPTGLWLTHELYEVFGVAAKLTGKSAQEIYDQIAEKLVSPEFRPRRLYERFNIEVLCTTDVATDPLSHHQAIRESGWVGRILPTFRPGTIWGVAPGTIGPTTYADREAEGILLVPNAGEYLYRLEDGKSH